MPAELPLTPAHYRVCFELVSGCHLAAQSPVYILRLYLRGSYRCPGAVPHTSRFPLRWKRNPVSVDSGEKACEPFILHYSLTRPFSCFLGRLKNFTPKRNA